MDAGDKWQGNPLVRLLVGIEAAVWRVLVGLAGLLRLAFGMAAGLARSLGRLVLGLPAGLRRGLAIIACVAAILSVFWATRDPIVNWYEANAGLRPLLNAKSWYYHLDRTDRDVVQRSDADLLVIDYATNGGRNPFSKDDVDKMRVRRDGTKRLVVSYMSVGEAETYRWYWQKGWETEDKTKRPSWLVAPNCAWPGAWAIKFWEAGWKDIVYRGKESYLKRIIDAGFDGVYLDRVDIFEQFPDGKHGAPADAQAAMVEFVIELAETARRLKPGFFVIPQNGEPLLNDKRYRRAIDGLGKEDLLFGHDGTQVRNKPLDVKWSYDHLKKLLADHKPIFAVEYLVTREAIAYATLEMRDLGLVPTFADRSLDGSDPVMPRIDHKLTEGTPEWIKTMCDKSNSW